MNSAKSHIVFLTPGFPEDENDSTCIPALQIFCKNMQLENGIEISVIAVHYPYIKGTYQWNYSQVFALGVRNKKRGRIRSLFDIWQTLSEIHKKKSIDVIHSYWLGECAFIGHYFSKKHHIPHITTLMGQDAKRGNIYSRILPLKKMKLITLSSFHQEEFLKNYKVKTKVIPWGIDDKLISDSIIKTIDIIGIGSFIPLKKYTEFIKTIQALKKEYPNITVVLIGDGILKPKIKTQIEAANLSNTISLKGVLPYKDTQEYLSKAKVLLHPSSYESFGMVFAEALAHNTAIVSRKVGIANAGENWCIGNTVEEFAVCCKALLKKQRQLRMPYPHIKNTIDLYLKMYADK